MQDLALVQIEDLGDGLEDGLLLAQTDATSMGETMNPYWPIDYEKGIYYNNVDKKMKCFNL